MKILPNFIRDLYSNKFFANSKENCRDTNIDSARRRRESGQALLIILLLMSVALTVTLSTVSRTVTDITITTYEEDSSRAFSAAEAGIEEALLRQSAVSLTSQPDGSTFKVDLSDSDPDEGLYEIKTELNSGESGTVWFVEKDASGNLVCDLLNPGAKCSGVPNNKIQRVCWGTRDSYDAANPKPVLELTMYYDESNNSVGSPPNYSQIKSSTLVFDPDNTRRTTVTNFRDPGGVVPGCSVLGYKFSVKDIRVKTHGTKHSFNIDNCTEPAGKGCILFLRARVAYNKSPERIAIDMPGEKLPPQGIDIASTGVSVGSTRKINVFQTNPVAPSIFNSAIFSLTSISK